jgi:hypothetical protein
VIEAAAPAVTELVTLVGARTARRRSNMRISCLYQYAETEPARDARLGETEPVAFSCNNGPHHVHLCYSDYNEGHLNCESQGHQRLLKQALWEKNQEFQTELPELRMSTEVAERRRVSSL